MKSIKVIISILAIVAILVTVFAFSGSAQVLLEKLTGTSQGGNNELPENPDAEEPGTEEDEESGGNDKVFDDALSDVSDGATLVWSEDFEDVVINVTTDTDGNNVYSTDNYFVYYDDGTMADRAKLWQYSDDNKVLQICPFGEAQAENKPNMQLAFDFTGEFNKKNLALTTKKFIIFEFTYNGLKGSEENFKDIVYYRFNIVSADGEKTSVISNSLYYSSGGFCGTYIPQTISHGGSKIVALIAIDEEIQNSDLYYFIDNTDQVVVHHDFLKSNSSYIGSFEVLFVDPSESQVHLYDDFKLYTFPSNYKGNISNALKEINFIN